MKNISYLFSGLLSTLFTVLYAKNTDLTTATFSNYIITYNKEYTDDDIMNRYSVYKNNLKIIEDHNNQDLSWKMGINQFTDLTPTEFKKLTYCQHRNTPNNIPRITMEFNNVFRKTPDSLDWTDKGAVTPIKDQGQCGSCWSFSTTGSVEGAYFLSKGKLLSFSEQQLVDCSSDYGNQGCNGGLMDNAFKYIHDNGICLENDYPYTATDGSCNTCDPFTKIDSFVDITPNNEDALLKAVNIQPISVAIEADQSSFQFYSSGVLTSKCGKNLDHGVLLVGYGTLNGTDYWKVKNSWGESWGDNGYILLKRNVKDTAGQCGITLMASYPIITE